MGLSIRTTPPQISARTTQGGLDIRTQQAKLDISQKQPFVKIRTEQPMVLIDQSQCFAEEGLKSMSQVMSEQAQKGIQAAQAFTGKKSRDGDAMAKIGHKASIMINIAKNSAIKKHEFGMGYMPHSRPKIDVKGGTVELEAQEINNPGEINGVSYKYTPGDIKAKYTASRVDFSVVPGTININYTPGDLVNALV